MRTTPRVAGFRSEYPAGFELECMAGFVGIRSEVLDTLRKLKKSGMTMIVVTHDVAFARESGDRVAFFDQGVICELGPARQVINDPKEERTRQFLQRVLH